MRPINQLAEMIYVHRPELNGWGEEGIWLLWLRTKRDDRIMRDQI